MILHVPKPFLIADHSDMAEAECLQVSQWLFTKHFPRSQITPSACLKHSSHPRAHAHTNTMQTLWQNRLCQKIYISQNVNEWFQRHIQAGTDKPKQHLTGRVSRWDVLTFQNAHLHGYTDIHSFTGIPDSLWPCTTTHLLSESDNATLVLLSFRLFQAQDFSG